MVHQSHPTETIVVGAGQAGLAAGAALHNRGITPIILDQNDRLGDSWRSRWDSLRLFTPAEHDGLPGLPFPAPRGSFPSKDEMADYLETYATARGLSPTLSTRVVNASRSASGWTVSTTQGELRAAHLIMATGTNSTPRLPRLSAELPPTAPQLHSSAYLNPNQIAPGDVLVVGAGTSGAEIALELASTHRVTLAGRPTPHIPSHLDVSTRASRRQTGLPCRISDRRRLGRGRWNSAPGNHRDLGHGLPRST